MGITPSGRLRHNPPVPSQAELILRLLLAATLAGVLGVERELTEQPAGFRTHILVGVGAALFAIISAYGFQSIAANGPTTVVRADLTRVASQIVVGIGFLGGGAILKYGASIRGLTTAANLWIAAAVGTAVGVGMLIIAAATTAVALLALAGLRPLRAVLRRYAAGQDEFVVEAGRDLDLQHLVATLRRAGAMVRDLRLTSDPEDPSIRLQLRLAHGGRATELVGAIAAIEHVRNVEWSR
jgi:putative Mg2+ transporter-C (MgtC) family protein